MEAYLRSLPKVKIEAGEEKALWERFRAGDVEARNRLALRHIGLAVKYARRFRDNGLTREDVVQEGFFGILEAMDSWDPAKGAFSTWAWYSLRKGIASAMRETGYIVRRRGKGPPVRAVSLSEPIHDDDGDFVRDWLADESVPGLDDLVEESKIREALENALRRLSPKQRAVLLSRYGLDGGGDRSLEEVAAVLGFRSRQRVHQVEAKALAKLRRRSELRALASSP